MLIHEHYGDMPDGTQLMRTYSDEGRYIRKIGTSEIYEEAVDRMPNLPQYEETDEFINPSEEPGEPDDEATEADYIAALQGFGVEV